MATLGGGALFDMGVYCVNAARYLFRAEPEEVFAVQAQGEDGRASGVDEVTVALLRFPKDAWAQFAVSQSSSDVDSYRLIGTKGDLRVEPAYTYFGERTHYMTVDGKTKVRKFGLSDQFAPELLYFAQCLRDGMEPEPSGEEGLCDVRVLEAIYESARTGKPTKLPPYTRTRRPGPELEITRPPVTKPRLVQTASPAK
jgi:predicted dehydrogenase